MTYNGPRGSLLVYFVDVQTVEGNTVRVAVSKETFDVIKLGMHAHKDKGGRVIFDELSRSRASSQPRP